MIVTLDTSFLLFLPETRLNVDAELDRIIVRKYKVVILKQVIEELERLKRKKPSLKSKIKLATDIARSYEVINFTPSKKGLSVDEIILEFALTKKNVVVCTGDRELKRKLRSHGKPCVVVREKQKFELFPKGWI